MPEKVLSPAQHEPTDVDARFSLIGVPLFLVTVIALALLVLWLYPGATVDRTIQLPLPLYPSPQLQPDPRADMAKFYDKEMKWLNGSGWIDKAHGITHIPIADAMRLVAQEGAPGWPSATEKHQ
jgi:hypothetical protein